MMVFFLAAQQLFDVDVAVLDDGKGVAEYEVLGAINVAVVVELAQRIIHIHGVLVALEILYTLDQLLEQL
jgi:hypothetical protein